MHPILDWGLEFIRGIQQAQGFVLVTIWRVFTSMGEEMFLLLLLPMIVWCVDYWAGMRLGTIYLFSIYLNSGLKNLIRESRPYIYDPKVKLVETYGYSFPSNHAQTAVVIWGYLAAWMRKRWFWYAALALMLLIGASRVALGVHFPTDVLAGWFIGALVLAAFLFLQPIAARRLTGAGTGLLVLGALLVPAILLLILHNADGYLAAGTLTGLGLGAVCGRRLNFNAKGPFLQRVLRFILGAAVLVVVYLGLSSILPGHESRLYLPFRYLRYAVVGFWAAYGAPWMFVKLGLSGKTSSPARSEGQSMAP